MSQKFNGEYEVNCRIYSLKDLSTPPFHFLTLPGGFYKVSVRGRDLEGARLVLEGRNPNREWVEIPANLEEQHRRPDGEIDALIGEIHIANCDARLQVYGNKSGHRASDLSVVLTAALGTPARIDYALPC